MGESTRRSFASVASMARVPGRRCPRVPFYFCRGLSSISAVIGVLFGEPARCNQKIEPDRGHLDTLRAHDAAALPVTPARLAPAS